MACLMDMDLGRSRVLVGDAIERLRDLPPASIHCVVTSPPYWGLRDYGVEGQGGLEETPEEHVDWIVRVFREVARVLKPTGTAWVNYGDCYFTTGQKRDGGHGFVDGGKVKIEAAKGDRLGGYIPPHDVLKPKDLVGLPWRVAFALQTAGWYLRSDIIWHKPNPLPESVRDRPTRAHEYLFLFAHPESGGRYFYDAEAIREPANYGNHPRTILDNVPPTPPGASPHRGLCLAPNAAAGRNKRTVWTIPTQPTREAHFATMPEALVEPCVKAGTSARGCCPKCGAPWRRVVDRKASTPTQKNYTGAEHVGRGRTAIRKGHFEDHESKTVGWKPGCDCAGDYDPDPCTVLDPFAGSGTTLLVANRLGCRAIGIELNPEYVEILKRRVGAESAQTRMF